MKYVDRNCNRKYLDEWESSVRNNPAVMKTFDRRVAQMKDDSVLGKPRDIYLNTNTKRLKITITGEITEKGNLLRILEICTTLLDDEIKK